MKKHSNRLLIFADIFIIFISLISSWMIRSRLIDFLYTIDRLYFILPYVLLIRIISNIFFEEYSHEYKKVYIEDIKKIFWHNMFPSLVFLLLRFFSPVHMSRMPLAMIFVEYFLTTAAMVLFRFLLIDNKKGNRKLSTEISRKALTISFQFGESEKKVIKNILDNYIFKIDTILTSSSIDWETALDGVKVGGDIELAEKILSETGDIDKILLVGSCTRAQGQYILDLSSEFSAECFISDEGGKLVAPDAGYFASDEENTDTFIPDMVSAYLRERNIVFISDKCSNMDWKLPPSIKNETADIKSLAVLSEEGRDDFFVYNSTVLNDKFFKKSEITESCVFIDDIYFSLNQIKKITGFIFKAYYLYCKFGKGKFVSLSNDRASEKIYEKYLSIKEGNKYRLNPEKVEISKISVKPEWEVTEFTDLYKLED